MEKAVLLAELRALDSETPDFTKYAPTSREHLEWLAKVHALVATWDRAEAASFRHEWDYLPTILKDTSVGRVLGIFQRAIATLSLELPASTGQAFGPGAVYDFLRALRGVLGSATAELRIVDPYLDASIFDTYLTAVAPAVAVQLLAGKAAASLQPAVKAFVAQYGTQIAVRTSGAIHDRIIFVDSRSCWVLGQSVKDAAQRKPTYLAPLSSDTVALKKAAYDQLWLSAAPVV